MITGYLQLIEHRYGSKLDADADEFIRFAVDGATRMQQLISDLLAYSRVDRRGRGFAPTRCDEVVERAVSNLQRLIDETGATVVREPLPLVQADASQLMQLFQNLIANAIKFRSDRTPEVRVSAVRTADGWEFRVADNGIGIEPQYFDRIFVIFQRLHGREAYAGTGIGLAICKRIVERHGGRIWVESEPGRGSTFHFTLPRRDS